MRYLALAWLGVASLGGAADPARAAAREESPSVLVAIGAPKSFDARLAPLRYPFGDAMKLKAAAEVVGLADSATGYLANEGTLVEFERLMVMARAAAPAVGPWRFVFYFSGHADERGLHFQDGVLSSSALRERLDGLGATTKVVLIDSCFAGRIAAKGVEAAPAFALPRLDMEELAGIVFLTASSARALAFESEELGGGVFTHFLVRGLGGQGDANRDDLVTIDELYQYVFREMRLWSMTLPIAAGQSPEIHADLRGRGALIVARPQSLSAGALVVDPGIMGAIEIASTTGLGAFRVQTDGLSSRRVPLPAGPYRAVIRRGDLIGEASFAIAATAPMTLVAGDFSWGGSSGETGAAKGSGLVGAATNAMLAVRAVADAASAAGPVLEVRREIARFSQQGTNVRLLSTAAAYYAAGETASLTERAFGATGGFGLTYSTTRTDRARLLTSFALGVESQRWTHDGEHQALLTMHPLVGLGAVFDMGDLRDARELVVRYDLEHLKTVDGGLKRRDGFVLGMTFRP